MKEKDSKRRRGARVSGRRPYVPKGDPTPIYVSRRAALVFGIVGAVLLALLLYAAPIIPTVAFGGVTLALILSYPVGAMSRIIPRGLAIPITVLALLGAVVLAFVVLIPLLIRQLSNFDLITPEIINSANDLIMGVSGFFENTDLPVVIPDNFASNLVNDLLERTQELVERTIRGLFGIVSSAFSVGIALFGILFVAVYLLVDVRKAKAAYLKIVPARYRRDASGLWDSFGLSLSRYLGGLLFIVVIQGVLSGFALYLLGVPYFLILGAWVSLTAIIPYLGAFLGGIPAVVIALIFTSPTTAVLTVIVYIAIQQLEGNLLTPRIQGRAVQVHPIIVLFAVIGGGQLAGLVGILFAVPALAVVKVSIDFLRARVRTKPEESEKPGVGGGEPGAG
ncbi:MAG: AI-2E family transporter [Rubrobacteraceae bacterium]|jgi:predicted PurR-regulated permease PerM|nr:AI-2E family transporter [Rubrobacter sp.]